MSNRNYLRHLYACAEVHNYVLMVLAELVSLFALCCYQCAGSVIVNVCSFRSSIVTWLDTTSRLSRGMTSHRTVTICTWLRGLGILRATLAAVLHGNDVDRVVKKHTILLSLFGAETYQHICNLATIWLFTILVYGEMGGFRGTWSEPDLTFKKPLSCASELA